VTRNGIAGPEPDEEFLQLRPVAAGARQLFLEDRRRAVLLERGELAVE
jgi:hypothetical protein